jgi:hypothetical protein
MNIGTTIRLIITGFALVALASGGSFALAVPATAVPAVPPAIPGVPDIGNPGEGTGPQTEPTIDPHGNPVWPTKNTPTQGSMVRDGWTEVIGVVDGARIRTRPVDGSVIGLIPYGDYYWISCKTRGSDGYIWGYAQHERRYGWVRDDLWDVVYYTAPNAPSPRPIPWC